MERSSVVEIYRGLSSDLIEFAVQQRGVQSLLSVVATKQWWSSPENLEQVVLTGKVIVPLLNLNFASSSSSSIYLNISPLIYTFYFHLLKNYNWHGRHILCLTLVKEVQNHPPPHSMVGMRGMKLTPGFVSVTSPCLAMSLPLSLSAGQRSSV